MTFGYVEEELSANGMLETAWLMFGDLVMPNSTTREFQHWFFDITRWVSGSKDHIQGMMVKLALNDDV